MAKFDKAAQEMLNIEGGYSNDPNDYGGETNWGICKREYPNVDIKNLTKEEALAIYKRDYWDKLRLDDIYVQEVALEIFDLCVQIGWYRTGKKLQEIMNLLLLCRGSNQRLIVDGLIGSKSLQIINSYKYQRSIIKCLNGEQYEHYEEQVRKNPRQRRFFDGWLKRT